MPDPRRNQAKYKQLRGKDRGGRGHEVGGVGFKPEGQYAMGVGPRTGGTAKPVAPLKSASRQQLRSARKTRRRIGTGSSVTKPRY